MPRRPNIEGSINLNLRIPETLRAKLDLHLWSDLEGCVPKGRYTQFFTSLLTEYFAKLKESANVQSPDPEPDGSPPLPNERRFDN